MESKQKAVYFSSSHMPNYRAYYLPYAWGVLRSAATRDEALARSLSWEPAFVTESVDEIIETIDEPFVFGFSCFVWRWEKQLEISRRVKEKYPDCNIVFGGPQVHISDSQFFDKYPWVDFVLHGEGEKTFSELLRALLKDDIEPLKEIPGISSNALDHWSGVKGERLRDYSELPSPFLAGYFEPHIKKARALGLQVGTIFETNRGCPYRCTYCDWGETGGRVFRSSTERFREEAEFFGKNQLDFVYCVDANTGLFPEDEDNLDILIDVKNRYGYPLSYYNTMAKNSNDRVFDMTKKLHDSGFLLRGASLSLQSLSKVALENIQRKMMTGKEYIDLFRRYMAEGIPTYTEIILGLPGETLQSFRDGFRKLWEMGVYHGVSVYPLSLLPNAPMNDADYKEKFKLETIERPLLQDFNEDVRESMSIVVATSSMSREEWIEMLLYSAFQLVTRFGGVFNSTFEWLHRSRGVDFRDFYDELFNEARAKPCCSVLGRSLLAIEAMYMNIFVDPNVNCFGYQAFECNGIYTSGSPLNAFWLHMVDNSEELFADLEYWVSQRFVVDREELASNIKFQKERLVKRDYDPSCGLRCEYDYDWMAYYSSDQKKPQRSPITVSYHTKAMGELHPRILSANMPIAEYLESVQGMDTSDRRRYTHPYDTAIVLRKGSEPSHRVVLNEI